MEAKTKLAEVYEITGQLQKALDLVNEGQHLLDFLSRFSSALCPDVVPIVLDARDKADADASNRSKARQQGTESEHDQSAATGSIFDESRRVPAASRSRELGGHGMTREQLRAFERQRQEAVENAFAKLDACEEAMLRGEMAAVKAWLDEAGTLVEDYRVTRPLFTVDRVSIHDRVYSHKGQ